MSEIEKMYDNAEVKKIEIFWCGEYDCLPKEHPQGYQINCFKNCGICSYTEYKYVYPPFTTEKQIELICFLLNANIKIDICKEPNMKMEICDIAEALAEVTNTIWQDLTEEEKQQVKGILE